VQVRARVIGERRLQWWRCWCSLAAAASERRWSNGRGSVDAQAPRPNSTHSTRPPQTAQSGTYKVTPNYETLFCAGHTWSSDGNLVAAGGDMGVIGGKNSYPFMKEGRDVVRIFDRNSLSWYTLPGVKLSEYRWYPTQVRVTRGWGVEGGG